MPTAGAAAAADAAAKATKKAKASSSPAAAPAPSAPVPAGGVGSGRAAAQNVKYDFEGPDFRAAPAFSRRGDVVEVKAVREAEDEAAALELLGPPAASGDGRFRLLDLAVFEDGTGELVPLDRAGLSGKRPLFASAVVSRAEGAPRSAGAMPAVGSSISSNRGSFASASANSSRLTSP